MPTFNEIKACLLIILKDNESSLNIHEAIQQSNNLEEIEKTIKSVTDSELNRKMLLCFNKYKSTED